MKKPVPNYNFGVEIECLVHHTVVAELDVEMRERGFSVSTDGSIDDEDAPYTSSDDSYKWDAWVNREYKGPVLKNYAAVRHLEEVLCLLYPLTQSKLFHTNKSCGFHVSISIEEIRGVETVNMFHAFLAKNFPQKVVTKLFGRTASDYCQPTGVDLRRDDSYEVLLRKLNENDSAEDKYRVIANRGHGRVECRAMGGKNYHMAWKKIQFTLDNLFMSARRAYYAI